MGTGTKTNTNSTSKQHRDLVIASILEIAAAANVMLPEATLAIYLTRLTTLSPESLRQATVRTTEEWDKGHIMPPIAFILERSGQSPELLAEQAWEWIHVYIRKHWHPDIGPYQGAPQISPAVDYAVRQCGGLTRIAYPGDREVDFIRRGFMEAHVRFAKEGGQQVTLSRELAGSTMKTIEGMQKAINEGKEN